MTTELISILIGGLGLGSLLTAITTHLVSRQAATSDRLYAEKREAYLGLLNALHQAAVQPSDENSTQRAATTMRKPRSGSKASKGGDSPSQRIDARIADLAD